MSSSASPTTGKASEALVPDEPQKPSRWKYLLPLGIVVIAAVVAYQYWRQERPVAKVVTASRIRTTKAVMGTFVRTVRVGGQTSARNYALMTVPLFRGPDARGNLNLLKLAKAGSMVNKGELVAQIDAQSALDRLDDANDNLDQAEANINKRRAEQDVDWGNLQQNLRVAKSDLDKADMEYQAAEVKTDIEREFMKLNVDEYTSRFKQMEGDLPTTRASDVSEIKIMDIDRETQALRRDRQAGDIKKYNIVAPMPGLVVMAPVIRSGEMGQIREGDQLSAGQALMKIVDPYSMQVEATSNQSESGEFRIGQRAVVGLDAFPDLRFVGHVYSLGAMAVRGMRDSYYVRTLPVRIAVEGRDSRFIPDLSGWADVELERQENVLLVPREAVQTQGAESVVHVRGATGFERRVVELGRHNATQAVVLNGLRAGEEVALEETK